MKRFIFILILLLIGSSACHTGTKTIVAKDMQLIADKCGESGKKTRFAISNEAQVFRLTNLDAPVGFKVLDVKSEDWSFYLVRFNLQILPLKREEVKSTYFAVRFKTNGPSSSSSSKVIINQLFPTSTSRQVYLLESDLKAGLQARLTAEAGYGWLMKKKKEEKEKETKEKTEKVNLSEKTTVTEEETTLIKEEGFDKEGKKIDGTKSIETKKSKVSETEKYDTQAVDKTLLRTLEKITDVNLNFSAAGKAFFEASAAFSMSYKKEKREPLITAAGRLSETAVWLDRQPFQNGDKYFSVIIKVPRPTKEFINYFIREFRKSKSDDLRKLLEMHKLQIDRHKVILRFADDELIKGVFDTEEDKIIKLIRKEIDELEENLKKKREEINKKLDDQNSNDKSIAMVIGGYLHDHLKWLYKYESFTELYEEALKRELSNNISDALKFATSYQLSQITRHRKDIQLFLSKIEIGLYQINCEAEAQLNVNGTLLTCKKDKITLSEPERVLSLVVE